MNDFNEEEFEKLKDSVGAEYRKIVSIYSPALKAEIFFNAKGLYHLRWSVMPFWSLNNGRRTIGLKEIEDK